MTLYHTPLLLRDLSGIYKADAIRTIKESRPDLLKALEEEEDIIVGDYRPVSEFKVY
jgi:hypothetical protein